MKISTQKINFLYLNIGHFLDHFFLLIFATVAALVLINQWDITYAELIPYATPSFVAFALGSIPAGYIADRWSREKMIAVFFIGIGLTSIFAGFTTSPLQIGIVLTLLGCFAAIYHPVGLAMVIHGRKKTGIALAVNGVWGNIGVACAALFTGYLIERASWQSAFIIPGIISVLIGLSYLFFTHKNKLVNLYHNDFSSDENINEDEISNKIVQRIFIVVFITAASGGLAFQSTTFALPKIFAENLADITTSSYVIGSWAFLVLAIAGFSQVVVGFLIDRMSIPTLYALITLFQSIFFILILYVAGYVSIIVAIFFMFLVFGQIPINDVMIGKVVKSQWRSRAFAIRSTVTFGVMASSIPLISWVHGNWGFDVLFIILAVCSFLGCLSILTIKNIKYLHLHKDINLDRRYLSE